jgi:hypothetical protein
VPSESEQPFDIWRQLVVRGEFEAAWKISDRMVHERAGVPCEHLPRHLQYFWDGQPLEGKRVLVRCYHGLGDTIQFIRYAPLLRSRAREIIVWAQPKLIPLLHSVNGIDRLLPLHDSAPEVEFDTSVELMELPHVFRTTLATIPRDIPYLHVTPAPLPRSAKVAVGLTWAGGDWNEHRSIPLAALGPLTTISDVDWYLFQRGDALNEWPHPFGAVSRGELHQEATLLAALDLMISVDTMTAHLAGALGLPIWTLLQKDADWRWMDHRDDSPWYPTMRLFRQERQGDWTSVVTRVTAALESFKRSHKPRNH